MAAPWVTSEDSTGCKIKAFERTVLAECFKSVL